MLDDTIANAQGLGVGGALWWNEAESTQKIYVDRQFFASFEEQVSFCGVSCAHETCHEVKAIWTCRTFRRKE